MRIFFHIPLLIFCVINCVTQALAAEDAMERLLPVPACAQGWVMDGTAALYNRDNLFERINGESELYFPYGFDLLASARYADKLNPQSAIEADIYRMGSLLDAFGMYSNYRRRDDAEVNIGGEGTISAAQLFFYQDRYLVRLQGSGPVNPAKVALLACARAIADKLPPDPGRPKELKAFALPEVEGKSVRYVASSLLGYDFFRYGFMADALLKGEEAQLFLIPEGSGDAARRTIDRYREYLNANAAEQKGEKLTGSTPLAVVDPMYGNVVVEQCDRFVIGVVRVKDVAEAKRLLGRMRALVEKL